MQHSRAMNILRDAAFILYLHVRVREGVEVWLYSCSYCWLYSGKIFMYDRIGSIHVLLYSCHMGTLSRPPKTMSKAGRWLCLNEVEITHYRLESTAAWAVFCAYATNICTTVRPCMVMMISICCAWLSQ